MPTREERIQGIHKFVSEPKNVGDEHRWDFWIDKVFFGDIIAYMYENYNTIPYDDFIEFTNHLVNDCWYEMRKPLEEQNDYALEEIYYLIYDKGTNI